MANQKSTHWVTIPDETVHTPVSAPAAKEVRKGSGDTVKNKLFWGVGFVILVVAATALMAPQEMRNILQGNLFEHAPEADLSDGVSDETSVKSEASPEADSETPAKAVDNGIQPFNLLPAKTAEEKAEEAPAAPDSDETMAVNSPVQPIVQAETEAVTIAVEPIAAEPAPSTGTPATGSGQAVPSGPAEDENAKVIAELQKQLEAMKTQQEEDAQKIDELKNGNLHAAADVAPPVPAPAFEPLSATPPGFARTTQTLGTVMQPKYRVNPYRVSLSPEETLLRNQAGKTTVGSTTVGSSLNTGTNATYTTNLLGAGRTPDSGPRETLMIAFLLTFLGLAGWKALKITLT